MTEEMKQMLRDSLEVRLDKSLEQDVLGYFTRVTTSLVLDGEVISSDWVVVRERKKL